MFSKEEVSTKGTASNPKFRPGFFVEMQCPEARLHM